jgi:hypothetical protein
LNPNDRRNSDTGPARPTRFNKWFLLVTGAALILWVAFLAVLAWKY